MKTLAFFFPYKVVSGCPVLFLNIARKMTELYPDEYKIYLVDYEDGYMAQSIKGEINLSLIPFKDGEVCLIETDYIIMQAYLPDAIRPEFTPGKETKVLMWVLYSWNFYPIVFPFNFFRSFIEGHEDFYCKMLRYLYPSELKKDRRFINLIAINGSVVFQDGPAVKATEKAMSQTICSPCFIPIASSDPKNESFNKQKDQERIHLGWVGRLCDFKIHILNYTMEKAKEYADKNKQHIVFHVVGNGELESILFREESEWFKVDWVGSVKKEELDRYMCETFHINFAMGTSVIESAKLGIPTVKLDTSYVPVKGDYLFRWFHETSNFDVGHKLTEYDFEEGNHSFEDIIKAYKSNRDELGRKDLLFYKQNFSLDIVSEMLHKSLSKMSLNWGDIPKKLLQRSIFRQVYYKKKYGIKI